MQQHFKCHHETNTEACFFINVMQVVPSTLPSVVVIKTFVAEMLTTWQMIPARCVSIFSTPEKRHTNSNLSKKKSVSKDLISIIPRNMLPFRCTCKANWVCGRASGLLTLSILLLGLVVFLLCVCGFSFALEESVEKLFTELNSSKHWGLRIGIRREKVELAHPLL